MKQLLLSGLAVAVIAISASAAPITATVIEGTYPVDNALLVVQGPTGVESHYLAFDSMIASSYVLVSQTGRVVVELQRCCVLSAFYVLDHLSGPGTYGAAGSQSPAIQEFRFDTDGSEFEESIRLRYRLDFVNLSGLMQTHLTHIDKHGNFYGVNWFGDADGGRFDDIPNFMHPLPREVYQTWKNFSPYPIPEPSTVVLMSFGLGALALRRGFVKYRRP